jgi:hypothetical protein
VSPGQGQRNGIRIAIQSVSMRPMRNREYRGCARPLSTGHTHLLHDVPFGDYPIVLRAGGCTTPSPGLSPTFFGMGPRDHYFLCVDGHRCQFYLRTPGYERASAKCRRRLPVPRRSISRGHGFQPSRHCPLQSRGLSSAPMELGTHLRLQTLRETEPHPFIVVAAGLVDGSSP